MSKLIDKEELLELFYSNPNREYHVREVARMTNLAPATASKYLDMFAKDSILLKRAERRHALFKANEESRLFKLKKTGYNVEKLQKSGLIDFLEEKLNYPEAVLLFGSYAKGENIEKSDIDLFVLTATKKVPELEKYEKLLKASIQLFLYDKKSFKEMISKNKELFNNIINGIKISGFLEVA